MPRCSTLPSAAPGPKALSSGGTLAGRDLEDVERAAYVNEVHSARARAELRKHLSVPWTPLHDLEVRNALRLLHGRSQIDAGELRSLLGHVDEDLDEGRLERPTMELEPVFRRAGHLSETHASTTLGRTLDALHIAALIELGCTELVSGDERQLAMARTEGIRASDIRRGA